MSKSARGIKTYENALRLLNTRRRIARPTRPPTPEHLHRAPGYHAKNTAPTYRGTPSIKGMRGWLGKLGYSNSDIDSLNVVHVAGTKGKGSTCAFTRSLLQQWKRRTGFPSKIGLYTSPDLTCVRERIQIDDFPISEELFTKYFYEVWERLFDEPEGVDVTGKDRSEEDEGGRWPRFLQFMALMAFHVFVREGAQAAIFETHHGGEYDATNFTTKPVVTGITTIGVDHILQLGPTIENIAWHKAGIFKTGIPAFSAPQLHNVETVLRDRAQEKSVDLGFVAMDPNLPSTGSPGFAEIQRTNFSLAIALTNAFLSAKSPHAFHGLSAEDIHQAVDEFSWPGRFEIISHGNIQYFLDGAHNELSIEQAANWFSSMLRSSHLTGSMNSHRDTAVMFAQLSEERDWHGMVEVLKNTLAAGGIKIDHMIFTSYQERQDGRLRLDRSTKTFNQPFPPVLKLQCEFWRHLSPSDTNVRSENSVEEALVCVRDLATESGGLNVLITGSLHLIGGALYLLRDYDKHAEM